MMAIYEQFPTVTENDFTRADWHSWLASMAVKTRAKNRELYEQHMKHFNEALRLVKLIYGDNSAEAKYLRGKGVAQPPNFDRKISAIHRKREAWLKVQQERERQRRQRQRSAEANERLQALGYVPGEHYASGRAITFEKFVSTFPPNTEYVSDGE